MQYSSKPNGSIRTYSIYLLILTVFLVINSKKNYTEFIPPTNPVNLTLLAFKHINAEFNYDLILVTIFFFFLNPGYCK